MQEVGDVIAEEDALVSVGSELLIKLLHPTKVNCPSNQVQNPSVIDSFASKIVTRSQKRPPTRD